ncbi:MAG TPA: WD40 repeat domain-containing protein [Ohtaekwangia sp.]|nr:WD40 repeat domain-containing protein [Ohtaekwangia sp.]
MSKIEVLKQHTFRGHNDCVYTLQPSSETNLFFSGSGDGLIALWDLANPGDGQLIAKLPNSIYALHLHRPSSLLVAGHNYDGIHVIDWQNKKEIASLQLTAAAIFDIQSEGDFLFIGTGEGVLLKVGIHHLNIVGRAHLASKSARCIAVHPERGEVAVGYSDNMIRVFDIQDLRLKYSWEAHGNSVFTMRYMPGGHALISGSRDARLKVWDADYDYRQSAEVVAHLYAINHLDFSPDTKHFVTCSMDKSIKVWDTEALKLLKVIDRARHAGHATSVNKVLWTSYQDQILSASDDRTISAWNIIF